jgi:hypothetical protein
LTGSIGIAVSITGRVSAPPTAERGPGAADVMDLVAGSAFAFQDRGAQLTGVPGERRLVAVAT